MMNQLTEMQARFVEDYIQSGSARGAALRAGYSPSTASNAYKLVLGIPSVQAAIQKLQDETREEVQRRICVLAAEAVEELGRIVKDKDAPATAKARAADSLLDRAGYVRTPVKEPEPGDELAEFLRSVGMSVN
jgi:phage terminase small subunit